MTNLDNDILKITKALAQLQKVVNEKFDILREIYYFNETLAITDGVPVATAYTPVLTLGDGMTIRNAKVTE